ncbi:hypothetical protein [Massilia sp. CFBP 13647]|uniref:hypothetical protein n=1 Tax=Massilia sp. CFBP 13647 TaxID=2775276 RepID=UPI001783348B|nr:hypothetical protein [Massilia sp. CFBP 13647]MBD8675129.1 hypothetical protein [Massilia sp. CFBP 13721]
MANKLTSGIPPTKRAVLRQLEDLLPQIEDGLAQGYSHAVMHAELPALGINISLPYYHRVLRLLRKERREGKRVPSPALPCAPVQQEEAQSEVQQPRNTRADGFPGAFPGMTNELVRKIDVEPAETKKFRWSGKELLDKDWTQF